MAHLSVQLNMLKIRNILGVFSAQDARIKLNPFGEYGSVRYKFRVLTWGSLEHLENQLFNVLTPPGGNSKSIFQKN